MADWQRISSVMKEGRVASHDMRYQWLQSYVRNWPSRQKIFFFKKTAISYVGRVVVNGRLTKPYQTAKKKKKVVRRAPGNTTSMGCWNKPPWSKLGPNIVERTSTGVLEYVLDEGAQTQYWLYDCRPWWRTSFQTAKSGCWEQSNFQINMFTSNYIYSNQ